MIDMQEHRDALHLARACRAASTSEADFKVFATQEEMLGGLR